MTRPKLSYERYQSWTKIRPKNISGEGQFGGETQFCDENVLQVIFQEEFEFELRLNGFVKYTFSLAARLCVTQTVDTQPNLLTLNNLQNQINFALLRPHRAWPECRTRDIKNC